MGLFYLIWKVLATRQASDNKVYEVLHKDNKAHVVKINDCPRAGETQYGYVFFDKSVRTPGPVRRVDKVNIYTMRHKITLIVEEFYLWCNQINNERNGPLQVKAWGTAADTPKHNTIEVRPTLAVKKSGRIIRFKQQANNNVSQISLIIPGSLIVRVAAENQIWEKSSLISLTGANSPHY